ncbi:hypothetical protein EBT31_08790 [bacterium]|nr:hypothetical protein [bacterium]NBX50133.1 hypothetical protein [bacterium]
MSLLDLRKQIIATVNTKAITKAMQLVAANKMKTFVREAHAARAYFHELERGYHEVSSLVSYDTLPVLSGEKTLFILFTSDKGLCGALNIRVMKALLASDAWRSTPEHQRVVITFGRKGYDQARRLKMRIDKHILRAPESLNAQLAWRFFGEVLDSIIAGSVGAVYAAHPVHETAFSFRVQVTRISRDPDQRVSLDSQDAARAERALVEPSHTDYLRTLEKRMLEAKIIASVAELKATEYSSRMVAMQKATDAATERIATLTTAYHKARQSLITQELAELSAAGEAMTSAYAYEIPLINA